MEKCPSFDRQTTKGFRTEMVLKKKILKTLPASTHTIHSECHVLALESECWIICACKGIKK